MKFQVFLDQSLQSFISVSGISVKSRQGIVTGNFIDISELRIVIDEEMHGRLGRSNNLVFGTTGTRAESRILKKSRRPNMEDRSGRNFGDETVSPVSIDRTVEDREKIPTGPEERAVRIDRLIDAVKTIPDG